ncbi:NAD(P)/FAD-dependent oxidoreductase [Chelativorans sp. YIM 93263]|uniref:NAD(P)/FAD-dependent oxidoreductase n=1 Tax=Chelativorans sp. YIM 93263 TaxID=2906648 RepID=UPI002379BB8D|nr:FAD-dependent oxidoreductase [Chelativorans sp. YIM 93263]
MSRTLIIGGSHAAVAAAGALRQYAPEEEIVVVSEEDELPYQRPPLSKEYMAQAMSLERLRLRPLEWYDRSNVELRLGAAVTMVERERKTVLLADGCELAYDKLLLATGAKARRLPADTGGDLPNVRVMRTLADANWLMSEMKADRRLVVVGGGYIGLEAAAEAAKKGLRVTVIEARERILKRVACEETANAFRRLHSDHDVEILENAQVERFHEENGQAAGLRLKDGRELPCGLVIAGIGIDPNTDLAKAAGLDVSDGIVVDDHCRTSDPAIFAAGDCTLLPFQGMPTRLESVQNAQDQATVAAANIAGEAISYKPHPWFWSDQYDVKLQIAGFHRGYDSVATRPGKREGSLSVFYFRQERLIAVDSLNDPSTYVAVRKLLEANASITRAEIVSGTVDLRERAKALTAERSAAE